MRIVCDTNVLISGTLFGGPARRVLVLSSQGDITNFTTPDLLVEVEEVLLRPKFGLRPDQVLGIISLFRDSFQVVIPSQRVRAVMADPDDNMVLEAAIAAKAGVIVSGDKHLLSLGVWHGIRIVSPADFVSLPELGAK